MTSIACFLEVTRCGTRFRCPCWLARRRSASCRWAASVPTHRQFTDHDREFTDDLATRVALAVENARLYENARTAIELRDTFLTIAAHELKTPLTTIQGYSQLLSLQLNQGSGMDADPVRRSARMIEDRTRHLARLVEQILDVSRLVASRMQLNLEDTDLVGMIRNLVAGFERHDARASSACTSPRAPAGRGRSGAHGAGHGQADRQRGAVLAGWWPD